MRENEPTDSPWQAFIFDFDGVLVDTVHIKTEAYRKMFERFGESVAQQVVEHHLHHGGMSRFEKFRIYYRDFLGQSLKEDEIQRLADEFSKRVVESVVAAPEIGGAQNFLRRFHGAILCFVNSGTPEEELNDIIRRRGWTGFFREILGSPATKRDNLKSILDRHGLDPDRSLFFGDALSDFEAAAALGTQFLGFAENADSPLLQRAPHISWVHDFNEATERLNISSKPN